MTQFRVLPVRRGDAYLLKSSRGSYLVDGGAHECGLHEMLHDRKIRKLRAAVCSCASPERLGGLLELMESDYPVAEYWLPEGLEVLPEMARRFNGDWAGWLHCVTTENAPPPDAVGAWPTVLEQCPKDESQRRLEGVAVLLGLALTACLGRSPYDGLSRDVFLNKNGGMPLAGLASFFSWTLELLCDRAATRWREQKTPVSRILRRMGWRLYFGGDIEELALVCGRLLLAEAGLLPAGNGRGLRAAVRGLSMAAMAAALISRTDARIRFFRHTGALEDFLVPRHPLKCVNGIEVSPLEGMASFVTPKMLMNQAKHVVSRRDGLVFNYGDARCGILFCGDTRMTFLGKGECLHLDRPTVITAPRQGSCSADRAYAHIVSADPIRDVWVRSFLTNSKKVSPFYKKRQNKICLNNCRSLAIQEILLEFAGGIWSREAGAPCIWG